ncbi:MAG TPA: 3-keto-5-aminohexanoate cleavage protein [Jatrophihabitantaceae bacterium]
MARILVEVTEPDPDNGLRSADAAVARLAGVEIPILRHGEDATCWQVFSWAVQLGLDTRIGLEETLTMPDGSRASGNPQLVRQARTSSATGSAPIRSASRTRPS